VHATDINTYLNTDPLGPGLLAIGQGGLDVEDDDQRLLQRGLFVYDASTPGANATPPPRLSQTGGLTVALTRRPHHDDLARPRPVARGRGEDELVTSRAPAHQDHVNVTPPARHPARRRCGRGDPSACRHSADRNDALGP